MLSNTGHPFVDIGAATLAAMARTTDPAALTDADLAQCADWLAHNYVRDPLKSFLTVAFTSNAWFAQSSFDEARRNEVGAQHLRSWATAGAATGPRCVFTGLPALQVVLSGKLLAGRAGRAQVPLAQGDEHINFFANGEPGLPISGLALLCLQAFPLGCAKVAGKLLAVHASHPALTAAFARRFWQDNAKATVAAQQAKDKKLAPSKFTLGTTLMSALAEIAQEDVEGGVWGQEDKASAPTLTAYYFSNGQTPELEIYHLPLGVTAFLRRAYGPRFRPQWQALVQAAWEQPKPTQGKAATREKPQRNHLFEEVLHLPDAAPFFLRRYFLHGIQHGQPAATWALTQLFLREVMTMDKIRIQHIATLADQLSAYVAAQNDRKLFEAIYAEMRYANFRNRLIRANATAARGGQSPLVTFEQFIAIFEDGEDYPRPDWKLARDLLLIRMIEQLHQTGWLAKDKADLPERPDDTDSPIADGENLKPN